MGMDITMKVIKNGEVLAEDLYEGRNSEWFHKLMGNDWAEDDPVYDLFPNFSGISPQAPDEIKNMDKTWYFGYNYINVKDYKDWFVKYRPDLKAGWVTTYEKWLIENKEYEPEDLPRERRYMEDPNDAHFVEYVSKWDPASKVYQYLIENNIPNDADITYYFDN